MVVLQLAVSQPIATLSNRQKQNRKIAIGYVCQKISNLCGKNKILPEGIFVAFEIFSIFLLEQNFVNKKIFGKEFFIKTEFWSCPNFHERIFEKIFRESDVKYRDFGCSDVRNWIFGKSSKHLHFRCLDT